MIIKNQPIFNRADLQIVLQERLLSSYLQVEKLHFKFKCFAGGWSDTCTRELIERAPAVAVLLYHPASDQVILVEQLRVVALNLKTPSPWILEPVGGMIEVGHSPEDTAYLEAQEEAGCQITQLIPIGQFIASPGCSTEVIYTFCGLIDSLPENNSIHGLQAEGEDIRVHVLSSEKAFELLTPDRLLSASGIILLQWLQLNKERLQLVSF